MDGDYKDSVTLAMMTTMHGGVDDGNCVGDGDDKHVQRDILPGSHLRSQSPSSLLSPAVTATFLHLFHRSVAHCAVQSQK